MATLEEFTQSYVPPELQQKAVTDLRSNYPGKTDDDIIAIVQAAQERSGTAPAESQPVAPQNAVAGKQLPPQATMEVNNIAKPGPLPQPPTRGDQYRIQNKMNEMQFGGKAEQSATDQGRQNNLYNEAGRNANLGLRAMIQAGGGSTSALDQDYKEQTAKANQPLTDLITQRDNAAKALEAQLRAGDIDAADARNQANKIGLESAQNEAANKALYAAALQNPKSSTSLGLKQTAKDLFPDQIGKITGFENMTGAQLLTFLPMVEKNYLAQLANDGKVAAANAKAAGKAGQGTDPKVVQKAILGEDKIDQGKNKIDTDLRATNQSLAQVDELDKLIKGGLNTGNVAGALANALPNALQNKERQRANQILQGMILELQTLQKGTQTEGDARRLGNAINMLNQGDPAAGIQAYREYMNDRKSELEQASGQSEDRKTRMRQTVEPDYQGPASAPKAKTPAKSAGGLPSISSQADYDALPVGATYTSGGKTYTKRS